MTDAIAEQLQRALGDTYRIERELGGGGMARVFLAEDLTLRRQVAVKVLPPETAGLVDIDRFKREIQLAARLQQPFIVPVLSAGSSAGLLYYTMPMVEGESLHARLARLKQLAIGDVVRILRDVLAALSYAHKHGVVHRDIKPANVLLSEDERAMLTDFGIAKALGAATGDESLTATGLAIGTPAYMAPEQAAADMTVDHRADLYAVGVLAYEMLAGVPPFLGASAALVMARQVREPAEPVTHHRPQVPPDLADLVRRLLQKIPADRPQSADEVITALDAIVVMGSGATPRTGLLAPSADATSSVSRHWVRVVLVVAVVAVAIAAYAVRPFRPFTTARSPSDETTVQETLPSLAVLPFVNESPDTTLAYFADGMTDELITALNGVSGLAVKSRSSVFALKGKGLDPARIGDTLHVTYLLEAGVRRAGNKLRMTATLLRARDGTTVWSGTFGGDLNDVFAVQASLAQVVVDSLRVRMGPDGMRRVATRSTTSAEAHDLYLRALKLFHDRSDVQSSVHLVQQALRHDSLFAAAHALLASDYGVLANDAGRKDLWPLAFAHAARAVELDSSAAEGHAVLAFIEMLVDRDWPRAARDFERAIALGPSYAPARDWHALMLAFRGHQLEAVQENSKARMLDPLSQIMVVHGAWIRTLGRELDSAAVLLRLGNSMTADGDPFIVDFLGAVYTEQGRFSDAIALRRRALRLGGADTLDRTGLATSLARAGQVVEARRMADEMRTRAEDGKIAKRGLALLDLALGDTTGALRWLARDAQNPTLGTLDVAVLPTFDGLHSQPAFRDILRALKLSP